MDNNATNHSYPRATDPSSGKWLEISGVSGNNFNVNVGTTPRANYLVSAADYTPTTGDMVLTIGSHSYNGGSSHTVTGANYNPTTGVMTVTVADHGFVIGDRVKFDDKHGLRPHGPLSTIILIQFLIRDLFEYALYI